MRFLSSWDDGYAQDRRVAELLGRRGLTGTFYVCPRSQHGVRMLARGEIADLASTHEIGAHSMTHPRLTQIGPRLAASEIADSKAWVEDITGKPCRMFCYPYGDVNAAVRAFVEKAGFEGARTTEDLRFDAPDPYLRPVTLQVTPFPWRKRYGSLRQALDPLGPLRARCVRLAKIGVPLRAMGSWLSLAKALFDIAREENRPFFHLYGHSREVDRNGMWRELEAFLEYVEHAGQSPTPSANEGRA